MVWCRVVARASPMQPQISMLLSTDAINTVAIVTRHNSHADFTIKALNARKHVFVEKPLALTLEELREVQAAHAESSCHLMVGFKGVFAA